MSYCVLPFKFTSHKDEILLVNFLGDYTLLSQEDFAKLLSNSVEEGGDLYQNLQSLNIISSGDVALDLEILSARYKTKQAYLDDFTTLHMVVTTLRCNQQCLYCHASAKDELSPAGGYDMSVETAVTVAEMIMKAPAKTIKVEFQGGEPTLNMAAIKAVVKTIETLNQDKHVEFVVCSNLNHIVPTALDFFRKHNFFISTSLDGPKALHDLNRVDHAHGPTHDKVCKNIDLARKYLGADCVGALMTAARPSLNCFVEIVDEYLRMGFDTVVFRALNPYGRGAQNQDCLSYSVEDFVAAFKKGILYIIELNKKGIRFTEAYTTLLLRRMLTPYATGYVDLQSPAGTGISGVIYNYDGKIYACDEGRMLAEMGDDYFHLGTVDDQYSSVFSGEKLKTIISESILKTMPGCSDCVYQMWCGADPARHYLIQNDLMGHKGLSDFCKKHKLLFEFLISLLESEDQSTIDILYSWVNRTSLECNCD